MSIKVIGAGVGRTGTTSLKMALEQLGFNKCYHMEELAKYPAHAPMWLDAADGKSVDWDVLFDGYQAAVDLPTYPLYAELMSYYPGAKVILTLRDPEAWFESASQTIFRFPRGPLMMLLRVMSLFNNKLKMLVKIEPVARKIGLEGFFNNDLSKENVIKVFNDHNEAVRQTVPPERLLVYNVKQGWGSLCDFLDVPVPDSPFPHKNTREEFISRASRED